MSKQDPKRFHRHFENPLSKTFQDQLVLSAPFDNGPLIMAPRHAQLGGMNVTM